MATAVLEKEMHGDDELVISGAPYPISKPSILGQGSPQQTSASASASPAAVIITSSPSTVSPSSPPPSSHSTNVDDSHRGETKAQPAAGVTPAFNNLAEQDRSGPSSIINKHHHHNCCSTDTAAAADDAVISQQQQDEPLLQPPQQAAGSSSEPLQIRIPPLIGLEDAQEVQVNNCQSEEQACHSGHRHHPGPGPLGPPADSLGPLELCLPVPQQTRNQIIPPQNAQARLTPHKHQELPTPAPPSYINSAAPFQFLGSQEGSCGKSQEEEEEAQPQPHDNSSGFDPQISTPLPNMIFSDLYKSPRSPFNKLRHSIPSVTLPATDLEADLISRDKTRQKEAVKKYLSEKIRNDWEFTWPPPSTAPTHSDDRLETSPSPAQDGGETGSKLGETSGDSSSSVPTASPTFDEDAPRDPGEEADSESDAESIYSTVSEDQLHFHPRIEWTSDISDDDLPVHASSPFRFDTPDAVGTAVQTSINERKARRRRAVREEISWNQGLACFEARRDAWTGAKTVRVKPKPATPISPSSTRRLSFWRHHRSESTASQNAALSPGSPPISSPLSPTSTHNTNNLAQTASEPDSSNASKIHSTSSRDSAAHSLYPVETLIPIAPPLLPPQNPMRASVTPSIYPSLYDKIVVHSLQPSCPVNLGDMLRACVVGWKRDGEWPPKSTIQVVPMSTTADAMVFRHQRKMSQIQAAKQHARKASTATNGSSRRLSFVGFLGGGNRNAGVEKEKPATIHQVHEEKEGGTGANGAATATATAGVNGGKDTHSDEANSGGGTGKGIRRSLQKVFSLGQHGHHAHPSVSGETAISPTKEVGAS